MFSRGRVGQRALRGAGVIGFQPMQFRNDRCDCVGTLLLLQIQCPGGLILLRVDGRLGGAQTPDDAHYHRDARLADDRSDPIATTYRFNVEYDESIFTPGSVRFEKDGWMRRNDDDQ